MCYYSSMKRFTDAMIVLICTVMLAWSVAEKHLFTAGIFLAAGIIFYVFLERETLD